MQLNHRQHKLLTQQLTQKYHNLLQKEGSSANIESTNKPLSLESNNVSHNYQATPSSETTSYLNFETSTTKTLLQRSIIIHLKVLPFHKKKLHLNLLQTKIIHLHKKKHRLNPLQMKIIHRNPMIRR